MNRPALSSRTMRAGIAFFFVVALTIVGRAAAQGPTAEPTGGNVTPNFSSGRFGVTHEFRAADPAQPLGGAGDTGAPGFSQVRDDGTLRVESRSAAGQTKAGVDVTVEHTGGTSIGVRSGGAFNLSAVVNLSNFVSLVGFSSSQRSLATVLSDLASGVSGAIASATPTPLFGGLIHGQSVGLQTSGRTAALNVGQNFGVVAMGLQQLTGPLTGTNARNALRGTNGGIGVDARGVNSGVRGKGTLFGSVGSAGIIGALGEGRIGTVGLGGRDVAGNMSDRGGVGGAMLGTFLGSFNEGARVGTVSLAGQGVRCRAPDGSPSGETPTPPPELDSEPCVDAMIDWRDNFCTPTRATFGVAAPNPYYVGACGDAGTRINNLANEGCTIPTDCSTLRIAWNGLGCTLGQVGPGKNPNCTWLRDRGHENGCNAPGFQAALPAGLPHLNASLFDIPTAKAFTAAEMIVVLPDKINVMTATLSSTSTKEAGDSTKDVADAETGLKNTYKNNPNNVVSAQNDTTDQGTTGAIVSLKQNLYDTFAPQNVTLPSPPSTTATCTDDFAAGVISQVVNSPYTLTALAVDLGRTFVEQLDATPGVPDVLVELFTNQPRWSLMGLGHVGTFGSSILAISRWNTATGSFSGQGGQIASIGGNVISIGGNVMAGTSTRPDGTTVGGEVFGQSGLTTPGIVTADSIQLAIRTTAPTASETCPEAGRIMMSIYDAKTTVYFCRRYESGTLRWRALTTTTPLGY